ncbi:collagenase-like [Pieris brassicae]|uniref:collagenase-like n=1 Tax=Pieris brassicae TaxID=7116 RepID=UPI001E662408|nr:collagenase-like [Pieris brassicae]
MIFLLAFALFNVCTCVPFRYHRDVGIKQAEYLMIQEKMGRIIGGNQVPSIMTYPYQAGIVATLTTGSMSICGGALVSNTRVLTAAHCWWDGENQARSFTVVLGSLTIFSGGTRLATSDVVVHPSWNDKDIINDIAVVRISRVQFTNNIQAITLPSISDVNNAFAGVTATATGYGKMKDSQKGFPKTTQLHHVNLKVLTNAVCQRTFSGITIHKSHLCTDGTQRVGTCEGDSGGPLTTIVNNRRMLIGIVSFGLSDGCERGTPSVYTRVTEFRTWINAQL